MGKGNVGLCIDTHYPHIIPARTRELHERFLYLFAFYRRSGEERVMCGEGGDH